MTRLVLALAARSWVAIILGLATYLVTVLFHDQVNETFLKYREMVGNSVYGATMVLVTVLGLVAATWVVTRSSRPGDHRKVAVGFWLGTLALIAVAFGFIVVLASEFIHVAQYATIAVFVFALTRRFTDTILWCTLLGALDEWYQYGVLHANWGVYFDFNDVILNLLGGAVGAVFLFAVVLPGLPQGFLRRGDPAASPAVWTVGGVILVGFILLAVGKLQLHPPGDDAWILLSRSPRPETFWNPVDWGGKPFHVLHPWMGVLLVVLLTTPYLKLDAAARRLPLGGAVVAFLLMAATAQATVPPTLRETAYIEPRTYACARTSRAPDIDGALDDAVWAEAAWTEDFVDITGDPTLRPQFQTRVRMLWDREYLYIAAEMREPHVWATLTEHDSIIFHDDDFEVFLDPNADNHRYAELEINALGTTWDLLLIKPYRDGGPALHGWEMAGLRSAVAVQGTLNHPGDRDTGWTVELAIPFSSLKSYSGVPCPPRIGDQWRINFSRVDWTVDADDGTYVKREGVPENNWVWSPQGVINMHRPETWGRVQFTESAADPVAPDPTLRARHRLHTVYYAQRAHRVEAGFLLDDPRTLNFRAPAPNPFPRYERLGAGYRVWESVTTPTGDVWVILSSDSRVQVVVPNGSAD